MVMKSLTHTSNAFRFCLHGSGDGTQGLTHAGHVRYHRATSPIAGLFPQELMTLGDVAFCVSQEVSRLPEHLKEVAWRILHMESH